MHCLPLASLFFRGLNVMGLPGLGFHGNGQVDRIVLRKQKKSFSGTLSNQRVQSLVRSRKRSDHRINN